MFEKALCDTSCGVQADVVLGSYTYLIPVGLFPNVRLFSCGLSTMFQGSQRVESYFSILSFDNNKYRTGQNDISIKVQFHARQCSEVEQPEVRLQKSHGEPAAE